MEPGVNLSKANLSSSSCVGTNLKGTVRVRVRVRGARWLTMEANAGAVLEGAMCANTVFQDANLAGLYLPHRSEMSCVNLGLVNRRRSHKDEWRSSFICEGQPHWLVLSLFANVGLEDSPF